MFSDLAQSSHLKVHRTNALGIGAASFWSAAEKDIAESPTASPERHKKTNDKSLRTKVFWF